jgi:hypothetical protein
MEKIENAATFLAPKLSTSAMPRDISIEEGDLIKDDKKLNCQISFGRYKLFASVSTPKAKRGWEGGGWKALR